MIYLILGLGLGLRLIGLNQSLWLDEAVQVLASRMPLNDFFSQYLPADFNPPGYYLITHYWIKLFGDSEPAVRMTSVILGTLSLVVFYLILRKLRMTSNELLITTLLLATGPLHIYYSQEARMYSLAVFSVLLTSWLFIKYLDKSSFVNAILVGFGFILMSMSHYLTLLTLPVFIFFLWRQKKLIRRQTGIAFLMLIISWILYFPIFKSQLTAGTAIKQTSHVWSQVIGNASLKSGLLLPVKFVLGRISIRPIRLYGLIAGLSVLVYWGTAVMTVINKKIRYKYLFLGLLIFPPVIGFLISFRLPVFSYFRFVFCLPFLYLLIGLSPVSGKLKYGLVIINLIFSALYLFNPNFHRENWKGLAEWLNQQNQPQVYVLNQVRSPLEYYYDGQISAVSNLVDNEDKVYLVSYSLPIFDPDDKIRQQLKAEGLKLKAGESFNKVGIEVWEK